MTKPSAAGSPIKALGRGSEALATLVAKPGQGLVVRKLYDPRGLSSPQLIGRKLQLAPQLERDPRVAKTLGFARTPSGGRMTFHEFVPGGTPGTPGTSLTQRTRPATPGAVSSSANAQSRAASVLRRQLEPLAPGYRLADVRPANMVGEKLVDYLPLRPHELVGETTRGLAVSPSGRRLFGPGRGLTTRQLNRLMGG